MEFGPIYGSIFNLFEFGFWCTPLLRVPNWYNIVANIPMDVNNELGVGACFRHRVINCFTTFFVSFLIAIDSTISWYPYMP